jgi:prepilin-type processing-associated H-X9-DG protein
MVHDNSANMAYGDGHAAATRAPELIYSTSYQNFIEWIGVK